MHLLSDNIRNSCSLSEIQSVCDEWFHNRTGIPIQTLAAPFLEIERKSIVRIFGQSDRSGYLA